MALSATEKCLRHTFKRNFDVKNDDFIRGYQKVGRNAGGQL